jgi:hypothetical protein
LKKPVQIPTLEEFLACCHTACEFLVSEYGFELIDSPLEYNAFSVRYQKGEFEVDIYGENWGANASCDLVKGNQRLYLGLLALADPEPPPRRARAKRNQLEQIHQIADLLKLLASDFLGGDTKRFDSALMEWKRISKPRQLTEAEKAARLLQSAVSAAGHAQKREDYAEVVRLLSPHERTLSPHQRQMLATARERIASQDEG